MIEIALGVAVFTGIVVALTGLILAARWVLVASGDVTVHVNEDRLRIRGSAGSKLLSVLAGADLLLGTSPRHFEVRSVMERIADEVGANHISSVALAFILKHPSRPQPIIGSNKLSRVTQMAQATELRLSRQQWYAILIASLGSPLP